MRNTNELGKTNIHTDLRENRSLYARPYNGYNADELARSSFLRKENNAVYWKIASLRVPLTTRALYRVSQEECARLREGVPYVKVYRYNPKYLYPKLNGYGDNVQRKVWSSCGYTYCTC
jgi:hypothetical protein